MPDEPPQDLKLLTRAAEGDRTAFSTFVTRHQGAVMRLTRALCASESEADDLFQETFLAAFRHAASFRGEASARGWLASIARRASWKAARRRRGEPKTFEAFDTSGHQLVELGVDAGWGAVDTPEALAERSERRHTLTEALSRLHPEARQVIALRDLAGLSGPEAAEALGISLGALKTRLHRARLALMAEMRRGGHHGA